VLDGDTDCIFLNKVTQFPQSGLATVPLYYMDDREHIETIIKHRTKYFSNSSIFLTHKSIFSRFKLYEKYSGYGYEDCDYMDTCIRNGIFQGSTDIRGIHLYHSVEERNIDVEANSKNKRLYLERKYSV
jgi:predicted glycosyltransferase involved in capsule biosynthesis